MRANRAVLWPTTRTAGYTICYQWFKQRLILSVSEPSISQQSQFKEDTVKPSMLARDFNLKAYATINLTQTIRPGWALNSGLSVTAANSATAAGPGWGNNNTEDTNNSLSSKVVIVICFQLFIGMKFVSDCWQDQTWRVLAWYSTTWSMLRQLTPTCWSCGCWSTRNTPRSCM